MTTDKPKVIREEYRLPINHPDHDKQTPFGELRYRVLSDGRHSVSLATAGNVTTKTYATVDEARAHWRKAREVLTGLGYERVKFTVKDGYVNVFTQGQSVWVRMPSGAEKKGAVVRLPGQTFGEQGETLATDRYRVRYWDEQHKGVWAHVTVGPDRLRARD